jgi:hypothetical protein
VPFIVGFELPGSCQADAFGRHPKERNRKSGQPLCPRYKECLKGCIIIWYPPGLLGNREIKSMTSIKDNMFSKLSKAWNRSLVDFCG